MLRKRQSSLCGAVLPGCGQAGPGTSARVVPGSDVGTPDHLQGTSSALVFVTGVTGIAKHHLVSLAQQIGQFADVGSIGGGYPHAMHRPAVDIRADVDFHAEVPLIAPLGLVHEMMGGGEKLFNLRQWLMRAPAGFGQIG